MKKRYMLGVGLIFCLLFAPMAYGMEAGLEMKLDQEEIILDQTFNIEITARDIDEIAGGDIFLYYDDTKIKLIAKEFKLEQSDMVDLQEVIAGIGDMSGKVRIFFGLKKDRPLLQGSEKFLAILTFEAIGIGEAEISLDPASQFVKETLYGTEVGYDYVNPVLSLPKQIIITTPDIQVPEDPNDESDDDSDDNPNGDPDDNSNDGATEEPDDTPQNESDDNSNDGSVDEPKVEPDENIDPPKEPVDKDDNSSDVHGDNGDDLLLQALDIHSINQKGLKLCSKIYWIDNQKLMKEIILPYHGDDLDTARLGIYYYHEGKQRWMYLGGEVRGNTLTVNTTNNNINFNKFAVLEDRTYPTFIDVEVEDMNPDLKKILTLGIMKGYGDLTLRLDQTMFKEEWITACVIALDVPLKEDDEIVGHLDVSPWARAYVQTAAELELLGEEVIIGHEELTAEEAIEILEKVMKRIEQSKEEKTFILEGEMQTEALLSRRQAVALLAQLLRYLKV